MLKLIIAFILGFILGFIIATFLLSLNFMATIDDIIEEIYWSKENENRKKKQSKN